MFPFPITSNIPEEKQWHRKEEGLQPWSVTWRLPLEPYRNRQQILGGSIQAPTNGFTFGCKKSLI